MKHYIIFFVYAEYLIDQPSLFIILPSWSFYKFINNFILFYYIYSFIYYLF